MTTHGFRYAVGLFICMAPFDAHATKLTFADANGVPSCNFISFHRKLNILYGNWLERRHCQPRTDYAAGSGVAVARSGSSTPVWSMSITDTTNTTRLFLLNIKAMTWSEYDASRNHPLALSGSGLLLKGTHYAGHRDLTR
jgi:hypothetical protein